MRDNGLEDHLSVQMEISSEWMILRVSGELDFASVPQLGADLDLAGLMRTPPRVAVDLSRMSFCDSSGLGLLVGAWRRLRAAGGELVLVRPQAQMLHRLLRTGVAGRLSIRTALPDGAT